MTETVTRTIRRARPEDSLILRDLTGRSSTHWNYPPDFFDWAPESNNVPPEYILANPVYVMEEGSRIVGYYGITTEGESILLDRLFVDRDRIGTGCGKALWLHALDVARDLGHTEMIIGSDPNAADFYRAMGAVWYEEKPTPKPEWTVQMFRYDLRK